MKVCDLCKVSGEAARTMRLTFTWDNGVEEELGDSQDLCIRCSATLGQVMRSAFYQVFVEQQKKENE